MTHCAAEIIEDNPHMGFRIIRIAYYPFAYQPRKRTIYKRKIDCVLNFNSTNSAYFHAPKISQRRTKLAKDYISSIIGGYPFGAILLSTFVKENKI